MNGTSDTLPNGPTPHEELVAYLDGELDVQAKRRLEAELSLNDSLRQQLKELQRTWDMLDELPRTPVSDGFTRTTVELVAIRAEEDVTRAIETQKRRGTATWLAGGVAILVVCLAGYWVVSQRLARPNDQLVRDLPIIEYLDAYNHAESIDFLRTLEKENLFEPHDPEAIP